MWHIYWIIEGTGLLLALAVASVMSLAVGAWRRTLPDPLTRAVSRRPFRLGF